MKKLIIFILVILAYSCTDNTSKTNERQTKADIVTISKVIHHNINWALRKDLELLYSTVQKDSTFLVINPDDSKIDGFAEFEQTANSFWMDPKFKATYSEVKNLRITFSQDGNVAWFFCLLDDFGEWDGHPYKWENARWTGVLEKINSQWLIRQMHISFPK